MDGIINALKLEEKAKKLDRAMHNMRARGASEGQRVADLETELRKITIALRDQLVPEVEEYVREGFEYQIRELKREAKMHRQFAADYWQQLLQLRRLTDSEK